MELIVIPQKKGLTVNFLNLSTKVLSNTTYSWDFGDGSEIVEVKSPSHTYETSGFYEVEVTSYWNQVVEETICINLVITNKVQTSLSGSIYNLIDEYLPSGIIKNFPLNKKALFIEKWQLYIQPLVYRELGEEIEVSDYNDELQYEALENQLIMEAAMLDFLTTEFTNMLQSVSSTGGDISMGAEGGIKKITTGPSEVEYFNAGDSTKDIISNVTKAMGPGGFVETLRLNLCTLATRLMITLPFCRQLKRPSIVPEVSNRREPNRYSGPNPPYPIKKGS